MVPVGTKVSPEAKALFHLTCDDLGVSEYDARVKQGAWSASPV